MKRIVTLEGLQAELAAVERKLVALVAASDFDPDADFALKTEIGGIRSESPRTKRLRRERWDRQAADHRDLRRQKETLEARIRAHQSHQARREQVEQSVTAVLRAMLKPGDPVEAGGYQSLATVTRVNAKSVSIRLPSGMTDRLPFLDIRPLEWDRMWREYQTREENDATTNRGSDDAL